MLGFIVVIIGIKEILAQNNDYVIHQAVKDFNPEFDMAFLNSELNLHFLEHSISPTNTKHTVGFGTIDTSVCGDNSQIMNWGHHESCTNKNKIDISTFQSFQNAQCDMNYYLSCETQGNSDGAIYNIPVQTSETYVLSVTGSTTQENAFIGITNAYNNESIVCPGVVKNALSGNVPNDLSLALHNEKSTVSVMFKAPTDYITMGILNIDGNPDTINIDEITIKIT